jgi:hypothetical protein
MRLIGAMAAMLLVSASSARAQDRLFSPAALASDLDTVRRLLYSYHPALHAWVDEATLDSVFDAARASLTRPMDTLEFLTILHPLVARVGCGHTYVSPPSAPVRTTSRVSLPGTLLFAGGECRIRRTYLLDDLLPPASKVLSINGLAAEALHERWLESVSSDGVNATHKTWRVNYEPPLGALAAVFGFPDEYELLIVPPGEAEPRPVRVAARPFAELSPIAPRV